MKAALRRSAERAISACLTVGAAWIGWSILVATPMARPVDRPDRWAAWELGRPHESGLAASQVGAREPQNDPLYQRKSDEGQSSHLFGSTPCFVQAHPRATWGRRENFPRQFAFLPNVSRLSRNPPLRI